MTGRRYYLIKQAAWLRHAPHCVETHFLMLEQTGQGNAFTESGAEVAVNKPRSSDGPSVLALIFVLVSADEAAHIALESDAECEALPHPLARMPVSERVLAALAPFGVAQGDDTFTVAEKLARVNPLLRHRLF